MATITRGIYPRTCTARSAQEQREWPEHRGGIGEATVRQPARLRLGTTFAEPDRAAGLTDNDIESIKKAKDKRLLEPAEFE